jgi:G:T-mismatch repair DNA endonuclease (very short patch repair protein)
MDNFAITEDGKHILQLYDEGFSVNRIHKIVDYVYGDIQYFLFSQGRELRNLTQAANLKSVRSLYKETCIKKYGKENALSKGTVCEQKRNKTVKEKYGVDNIFQTKETKIKILETLVKHNNFFGGKKWERTKPELIVEQFLKNNNINYRAQCFKDFKSLINGEYKWYIPDFVLDDYKIIIEVQGNFWHANPLIYKAEDFIPRKNLLAKEIWKIDLEKKLFLESFNYTVLYLWETEILNDTFKQILLGVLK